MLTQSPLHHQHVETAYGLASAALDQGHTVAMFCYIDGVYGPMQAQDVRDALMLPREQFSVLLGRGVSVTCCGLSVNGRGLDNHAAFLDGVTVGMLSDLANLVSECDRVVSL